MATNDSPLSVAASRELALDLVVATPELPTGNIFFDTAESADFEKTNATGFQWRDGERPRVSIVRDDGYVVHNGSSAVSLGPFPEREWENNPDTAGSHAWRFRYDAADSGGENTEIRFDLGTDELPTVEFRWAMRVPINFSHNTASGATNNKLAAFWMDGYEYGQSGPTAVLQFRRGSGGTSLLRNYYFESAADGSSGEYDSSDPEMLDEYLWGPADAGRWLYIRVRLVVSSDDTTADGVYEISKKWQDSGDWITMFRKTDAIFKIPSGYSGWNKGYLMGFANAPYAEDTEFLLDDFHVSTESLL